MRKEWQNVQLADVCEKTNNINWSEVNGQSFKYVDLSSVSRETLTITVSSIVNKKNAPSRAKKIIKSNDIIFATTRPTLKRVTRINEDFNNQICSTGYCVLRPQKDKITSKFIYYFILTDEFMNRMESLQRGASYPAVSDKDVKSTSLNIPPLPEQKAIVKILDEAFAKIDQAKVNIEKNIENAKELFQSKLNEIFSQRGEGWEEKSLGEIGKVSMCKRILKNQTNANTGIPFYKIGTFGKEANAFISEEIYNDFKSKYSFPKKGDVLISASGTIGKRVIYDGKPAYFQDSNIVWIDNNEELILNDYLYQFYGVCDWNPSKGATISRLYNADLRRIKISYPSKKEQKELICLMVDLSNKKSSFFNLYKEKIDNLDELRKSLLQKAFSGELV